MKWALMRLPIRVAHAVRSRKLIDPGQRILIALSGGPDSMALLHCLLELSRKRDLAFSLAAAHLNHGLRGRHADADEAFCMKICARKNIELIRGFADTPKASKVLKKSREESARILRHAFLSIVAARLGCQSVAVAHHADDRIETVIYRLCRGTGLAGLQGIGWSGPVHLAGEPDVDSWLQWRSPWKPQALKEAALPQDKNSCIVIRPLLACTRSDVLEYLRSKRQKYCTDETNFDARIPRNAIRRLVLPLLEGKVHPGARAALWRLAEEAEVHAEKRAWRRDWLLEFANIGSRDQLLLPVARLGPPPTSGELSDLLEALRLGWNLTGTHYTSRHAQSLQRLFQHSGISKNLDFPGISAMRRKNEVVIRRRIDLDSYIQKSKSNQK